VYSDDPRQTLTRIPIAAPEGQFEVLVPDLPDAQTLLFFGTPDTAPESAPSRELFRADVDELRKPRGEASTPDPGSGPRGSGAPSAADGQVGTVRSSITGRTALAKIAHGAMVTARQKWLVPHRRAELATLRNTAPFADLWSASRPSLDVISTDSGGMTMRRLQCRIGRDTENLLTPLSAVAGPFGG
jgi:hypothetical protein